MSTGVKEVEERSPSPPVSENHYPEEDTESSVMSVKTISSVHMPKESSPFSPKGDLNKSDRCDSDANPVVNTIITVGSVAPRNFSGQEDINDWINHFKHIAKCNNWSDRLQLNRIPIYLTGTAEMWFSEFMRESEEKGEALTIQNVLDGLINAFRPQNYRSLNHSALINRRQRIGESFHDYYIDMVNLCRKVNPLMSEQDKFMYITNNMRSTLIERVMILQPKSCKELLEKCKACEEIEGLANNRPDYNCFLVSGLQARQSTDQTPAKLETSESAILEQFDKLLDNFGEKIVNSLQRPNNFPRNQRTVDGKPICNSCGLAGHFARTCYRNRNRYTNEMQSQPQQSQPTATTSPENIVNTNNTNANEPPIQGNQ